MFDLVFRFAISGKNGDVFTVGISEAGLLQEKRLEVLAVILTNGMTKDDDFVCVLQVRDQRWPGLQALYDIPILRDRKERGCLL